MSRYITIQTFETDDEVSSGVRVLVEEEEAFRLWAQSDCPEDFSIRRMGIVENLSKLFESLGENYQVVEASEDEWYV